MCERHTRMADLMILRNGLKLTGRISSGGRGRSKESRARSICWQSWKGIESRRQWIRPRRKAGWRTPIYEVSCKARGKRHCAKNETKRAPIHQHQKWMRYGIHFSHNGLQVVECL